jgi:hypothetical protein
LIRTALARNSKSALISELSMGVKDKFDELCLELKELNRHYDNLSSSFKLYLKIKAAYYEAFAIAQQAKFEEEEGYSFFILWEVFHVRILETMELRSDYMNMLFKYLKKFDFLFKKVIILYLN